MVVGIVGFGLIGRERMAALLELQRQGMAVERIQILDPNIRPEKRPQVPPGVHWSQSLDALLETNPDWLIVATPHDIAARIVPQCLAAGVRVLMEKPLGRNLAEARELVAAQHSPRQLWVGLNYRFYSGINTLLEDARNRRFGDLVSIGMTLGHGGSPGMETGWKFDPEKAGGGCLIDPGIHLLDLCRLLVPDPINVVGAAAWSGFWKTGIEEEAHVLLRSGSVAINLQVSVVRWRSQCRIEVNGTNGYGVVTGRGRSYGPQRYIRGERWAWRTGRSQPDTETLVLESAGDESFLAELRALLTGEPVRGMLPCSADEALAAMELHARCLATLSSASERSANNRA